MAAYIIAEIDITDSVAYDEYRKGVPASIAAHGGRYLARGGATEVLEGDNSGKRMVILEFPSMERLKAWYDSSEYKQLREIRRSASNGRLIAIEGVTSSA
jgi:uncharacterized protein (DUF1330 family)